MEALGRRGDVLVAISTSGRSANVVRALETARGAGLQTIALLGGDGGPAQALSDVALVAAGADTQHVQEVHAVVIHLLCELVEGPAATGHARAEAPAARAA